MKRSLEERDLRLRDLVKQERLKIIRRAKRGRWAEYMLVGLPALFNQFRDEGWAKRLKESINDWNL